MYASGEAVTQETARLRSISDSIANTHPDEPRYGAGSDNGRQCFVGVRAILL